MRITREELYKDIWSEPATKLAQRYDVSSSYLARVCEGLNVPHPSRGYWARKAAGETLPVPPLPPRRSRRSAVLGEGRCGHGAAAAARTAAVGDEV